MICFPFDNASETNRDRAVGSSALADFFKTIAGTNGIFNRVADGFTATADGLKLTVKIGYAIVEGHIVRPETINETQEISVEMGSEQDRIDSIVLQLNPSERIVKLVYKKGTPSANPQPPALDREAGIYEIQPFQFRVKKLSVSVENEDIEDTRLDSEKCGIVPVFGSVDTTALYNQIQADLKKFKEVEEAEFLKWFEDLQAQLEGDVAANLQRQILDIAGQFKEATNLTIPTESWVEDEEARYPRYPFKAEIPVEGLTEDFVCYMFTPDHTNRDLDMFFGLDTFVGQNKFIVYGNSKYASPITIENALFKKVVV